MVCEVGEQRLRGRGETEPVAKHLLYLTLSSNMALENPGGPWKPARELKGAHRRRIVRCYRGVIKICPENSREAHKSGPTSPTVTLSPGSRTEFIGNSSIHGPDPDVTIAQIAKSPGARDQAPFATVHLGGSVRVATR